MASAANDATAPAHPSGGMSAITSENIEAVCEYVLLLSAWKLKQIEARLGRVESLIDENELTLIKSKMESVREGQC